MSKVDVSIRAVALATKESELCYALAQSVSHCNLVFIVGGMDSSGPCNIHMVLSKALSIPLQEEREGQPRLEGAGILYNPEGDNGYVLEADHCAAAGHGFSDQDIDTGGIAAASVPQVQAPCTESFLSSPSHGVAGAGRARYPAGNALRRGGGN